MEITVVQSVQATTNIKTRHAKEKERGKAMQAVNTSRVHFVFRGLLGVGLLGAWQWRAGEGGSRRPGAWRTTLQTPINSVSGFLLG
eukprot:1114265-Pelagomonas_calceolata.AAC.1